MKINITSPQGWLPRQAPPKGNTPRKKRILMGPTFQSVQISRSPDDPFWKHEEKESEGERGRPNSRRCLRRPRDQYFRF